ncbi:MAG TPA: cation:proton antiporter, partial [Candidatus Dormibacteraeota bacterium]|nr:cation:proton antiporter [Candidatus Dormibacteraeota bacterium]
NEHSLARLRRGLARTLVGGTLQVVLTIVASAGLFSGLGYPAPVAFLIGFLLALSSTAIVLKMFSQLGEVDSPQGQASTGILLFQDLMLVPMMLLVPALARPGGEVVRAAGVAVVQAAVTIAGLLLVARTVLPRALGFVARAGTIEIFPLVALVVALGTAVGAAHMGLSLSLGAFLAGLALSGTPYAHQVFAELLPLRDACVAIFFTSIGMLVDPAVVAEAPGLLFSMLAAVGLKALLIVAIIGALWRSWRLAAYTGLALAQIGEFAFVLAREGVDNRLIAQDVEQAFLGAAILSMAATPLLIAAARRLGLMGAGRAGAAHAPELGDHVLVIGYGVTGQAVARVLGETGIPFVAVDLLPDPVASGQREGLPVRFGDATRRAVLDEMGAAVARAAVIALGDPLATRRVVAQLRRVNRDMRILVRVQRVRDIDAVEKLGADEVIPSELETSIELIVRLLTHFGVPRHVVRVQESVIRLHHYQALRELSTSAQLLAETQRLIAGGILESAQVMHGCRAAGRTLAELDLRRRTGATVLNIVRDEVPLPTADAGTVLEVGDLVVLYGSHEAIDRACRLLEPEQGGHRVRGGDAEIG